MTRPPRSRDLFKTVLRLFKREEKQLELDLNTPKLPKPPDTNESEEDSPSLPDIVRSELNLEQNAVFTVSTYREKSRTVIRTLKTQDGTMERRVEIGKTTGGQEVGVLTTTHFKVYLALLEFWEKAGKPVNKPVHFTILRILKRLKLSNSGGNYETILKAIAGLRDVPVRFTDSFMSKDGTFKSTGHLSVLSYLHTYEKKARTKSGEQTYGYGEFQFDNHILMSLIENFTHPLRLDVITEFTMHRDLAILLYTYLDRQLAFKRKFEIGLGRLYDQLDLSQSYIKYPSQRKSKIDPVLEQIQDKELSTGKLSYCKIERTADGKDYKLVCKKTGVTKIPEPEPPKLDWGKLNLDEILEKMDMDNDKR